MLLHTPTNYFTLIISMAIDLCSDKTSPVGIGSNGTTPRISFSYDFLQSDVVPIEQRPLRSSSSGLNSSIDFDFCVRQIGCYDHEPSPADELFSDGKILPCEIKKKCTAVTAGDPPEQPAVADHETAQKLSQAFPRTHGAREENGKDNAKSSKRESNGNETKSFWRFRRSSSCGSGGYGRSLCPLPLLSRSNSTGSADETKPINIKRTPLPKEKETHGNTKQSNSNINNTQKPNSSFCHQKPPLKKSLGVGAYGNGVSINPVLNVPPANLFAMGSIFSNGKNKPKKK